MENCIETEILGGPAEAVAQAEESQPRQTGVADITNSEEVAERTESDDDVATPADDVAPNNCEGEATPQDALEADQADEAAQAEGAINRAEMERLITEAEARGYERGRNAGIETWLNESRRGSLPHPREKPDCDSEIMILNNMRRSVWDE